MACGDFRSGSAHPRYLDREALLRELKELALGTLTVTGASIITDARSRISVETTCTACGSVRMTSVDSIRRRTTTNCRCQRGRKYYDPRAAVLGERFDAI